MLKDKYLLRTLAREWLPQQISERPKPPYRAPIHRCFTRGVAPEYVQDLLAPAALKDSGVFNPIAVGQLVQKLDKGAPLGETEDMAVAGIVSAQLVHHQFVAIRRQAAPLSERDSVKVCRPQR